jgi:tRNA (guanine-N1)-methyltransferase
MRFDVVSLVPDAFTPLLGLGVIGRAFAAGIAEVHTHNPRDHATDRYRNHPGAASAPRAADEPPGAAAAPA